MSASKTESKRVSSSVEGISGINLSAHERASMRARMAQAEAIADGAVAVYRGLAAAAQWVVNGASGLARRVRAAFMKPAHH